MHSCFDTSVNEDLVNITALVDTYFNNKKKTSLWMLTPNPLLGGQVPKEMIIQRRTNRLRRFIQTQLYGYKI